MPDVQVLVRDTVSKLRKRKIEGSEATARLTAELLRAVISQQREPPMNAAVALIEAVRSAGEQLIAANPFPELAVGNILRRVLHIIREENGLLATNAVGDLKLSAEAHAQDIIDGENDQKLSDAGAPSKCLSRSPSLLALLGHLSILEAVCQTSSLGDRSEGNGKSNESARSRKLKPDVIKAITEVIEDIDTCHEQIAEQAVELINHNEKILTFGHSKFVMEFLCAANAKKGSIDVFIAEGSPKYQGHDLAKRLSNRGLNTTVITDSAIFAMISRVNMVVVGIHAVMANGGIIAPVGLNMVALAAKKHAVPFVVVAGVHEFCSLNPHNPEVVLNELRSPSELLNFEEFSECMDYGVGSGFPLLKVVNPAFDYIPPELVTLFVTDVGGYDPSYIYRLIADYYFGDDLTIQQKSAS